jgi:DTW domain-containing protein YfiP
MTKMCDSPRPTRHRPTREQREARPDLEALRATVGPPLSSSRKRKQGVEAHDDAETIREARAFCYRCHKAAVVCVCDRIRRVSNRTDILIFQHPRERFHPLGTARIAALSLEQCQIVQARGDAGGLSCHRDTPPRTGVLYPGAGAAPLDAMVGDERPEQLIVLDGTWSHAHALYRENAWLRALPHYELRPAEPSRYRIRKEPKAQCISTIESIVCALEILEPETEGLAHILRVFDSMIDDQIRFML